MQQTLLSLTYLLIVSLIPVNDSIEPILAEDPGPTIAYPQASPTPTRFLQPPTSSPARAAPEDFEIWFLVYATEYAVPVELLKRISYCESTYNPMAVNGQYGGLFQFSPSTWSSTRNQMGLDPSPDLRFNPKEAIRTAAFKISAGGQSAWIACLPSN